MHQEIHSTLVGSGQNDEPNGAIEVEGKVETCAGCHRVREGHDYLYTADLK